MTPACTTTLLMLATFAHASVATPPSQADRLHARAVQVFREGRFPEAYGRFVGLANAGHPASARYALWMCEHGLALFGSLWDCAPHEQDDWTRLSMTPRPTLSDSAVPSSRRVRPLTR